IASGSTFSASMPRPVGASHSSHTRPSTIKASTAPTASARVQATAEGRAGASFIAGYDASNEFPGALQDHLAGPRRPHAADAADMALVRHTEDAAPALSRRPARHHRQQPDVHDTDLAGAAGDGDAGAVRRVPDVLDLPG